jgi:hypothetical protein
MWNNPQLYPQMFPWLFPYGLGGIGSTSISHKEHKRHLLILMYHDKRFQTDINFSFVAFSHEQMMANTTQSFLLIEQKHFGEISNHLMNVNWATLDDLTKRLEVGEHIPLNTQSDSVKQCKIWSLTNHLGSPSYYSVTS